MDSTLCIVLFFFNDTATTEIYTLSLHAALPILLRRLRRASLAVLRKEVEAVDQRRLAAFLPSWQGVDRHPATGAGVDRLREALVPLQGLALPADVWERDVLPRRIGAYSPTWLDQLCASGEVVWVEIGRAHV